MVLKMRIFIDLHACSLSCDKVEELIKLRKEEKRKIQIIVCLEQEKEFKTYGKGGHRRRYYKPRLDCLLQLRRVYRKKLLIEKCSSIKEHIVSGEIVNEMIRKRRHGYDILLKYALTLFIKCGLHSIFIKKGHLVYCDRVYDFLKNTMRKEFEYKYVCDDICLYKK